MEFTLAFGAVGDFIAVIALIKDIIKALDDSRGSAKDYRDVVHSLEILQRTVEQVSKIYDDHGVAKDLRDLRILAMNSTSQIRKGLEAFRDRNRKYDRSLGAGATKNIFRHAFRKIQWSFEEKDAMKFRDEMRGYTVTLSMLLDITIIRLLQRNHEARVTRVAENEDRTAIAIRKSSQMLKQYFGAIGQRMLSKLSFIAGLGIELRKSTSDLMTMMVSLSGDLSGIKAVLTRLERPLNDEHFILEDITGRVFPIHLKTITSWDAFDFILAARFRGKKGAHRVKGKRYSLQERASHRQVDRSIDWESAFLPYQKIDMSLICRESQTGSQTMSSMSCPWCRTVSPGSVDRETQCRNCYMFFKRVYEKDDAEARTNITPVAAATSQAIPSASSNLIIRFGEPSFKPQKRKRGIGRPEICAAGDPRATKRRQRPGDGGNKVLGEDEYSDSDDEDFRGFIRITLVSKRPRTKWFTSDQTETFATAAQRLNGNDATTSAANNTIRKQVSYSAGGKKAAEITVDPRAALPAIAPQSFRDNVADDMELKSDSGDDAESGSEVFQRDTSPEDEVTMEPQLPTYRKDRQAGFLERERNNIPKHLAATTWGKRQKPIVFLDHVFDCTSLARWIKECVIRDGYWHNTREVHHMLVDIATDLEFLEECRESADSIEEEHMDVINSLLSETMKQVTLLQRAIQISESSVGHDTVMGRSPSPHVWGGLYSGTALALTLKRIEHVPEIHDMRWSCLYEDHRLLAGSVDDLRWVRDRRVSDTPVRPTVNDLAIFDD